MRNTLAALFAATLLSPISAQAVLGRSDPTEKERIQALIADLTKPESAARARRELLLVGRPAIKPLLRRIIQRGRIEVTAASRAALVVIGRMGPRAGHVFTDLAERLPACREGIFLDVLSTMADLVPYGEYQGRPALVERIVKGNAVMFRRLSRTNNRQKFQYRLNRLQQRCMVDPDSGLDAMIAELGRNRTHRREVAAEVLGRMGKGAAKAIPAILRALEKGAPVVGQVGGFRVPRFRDEFPRVASTALIQIAPSDPRTSVAWGWRLEHTELVTERITAIQRIGSFGERSGAQASRLVDARRAKDPRAQQAATTALGMIGKAATMAIPKLEKLTGSNNKALAARARAALSIINPK